MRFICGTTVAAVFASVGAAHADMTGNDLKEACAALKGTQASVLCLGYIGGALDSMRAINHALSVNTVCEPRGVTGDQLIAMTRKYLDDHPTDLHLQAASLIIDMITTAYPCQKNSN